MGTISKFKYPVIKGLAPSTYPTAVVELGSYLFVSTSADQLTGNLINISSDEGGFYDPNNIITNYTLFTNLPYARTNDDGSCFTTTYFSGNLIGLAWFPSNKTAIYKSVFNPATKKFDNWSVLCTFSNSNLGGQYNAMCISDTSHKNIKIITSGGYFAKFDIFGTIAQNPTGWSGSWRPSSYTGWNTAWLHSDGSTIVSKSGDGNNWYYCTGSSCFQFNPMTVGNAYVDGIGNLPDTNAHRYFVNHFIGTILYYIPNDGTLTIYKSQAEQNFSYYFGYLPTHFYQSFLPAYDNIQVGRISINQTTPLQKVLLNTSSFSDVLVGTSHLFFVCQTLNSVYVYNKNSDGTVGSYYANVNLYSQDSVAINEICRNGGSEPSAFTLYSENGSDYLVGWSVDRAKIITWSLSNSGIVNRLEYNAPEAMARYSRAGWDGGSFIYFLNGDNRKVWKWDLRTKSTPPVLLITATTTNYMRSSFTGSGLYLYDNCLYWCTGSNENGGWLGYIDLATGVISSYSSFALRVNQGEGGVILSPKHPNIAYTVSPNPYGGNFWIYNVVYKPTYFITTCGEGDSISYFNINNLKSYSNRVGNLQADNGTPYSDFPVVNAKNGFQEVLVSSTHVYIIQAYADSVDTNINPIYVYNKNSNGYPTTYINRVNWGAIDPIIADALQNAPCAHCVYEISGVLYFLVFYDGGSVYRWQIDKSTHLPISSTKSLLGSNVAQNAGAPSVITCYGRAGWDGGSYIYVWGYGDVLWKWNINSPGALVPVSNCILYHYWHRLFSSFTGTGLAVDSNYVYWGAGADEGQSELGAFDLSTLDSNLNTVQLLNGSRDIPNSSAYRIYNIQLSPYHPKLGYGICTASKTANNFGICLMDLTPNSPPTFTSFINLQSNYRVGSSVTLQWSPSTDPENISVVYDIDYLKDGTTWTNIATGATGTSITFTLGGTKAVANGKFKIKARDDRGYTSSYSTTADIPFYVNNIPTDPPSIAVSKSIAKVSSQVTVSWGASSDADNDTVTYKLEFYDGAGWYTLNSSISDLAFTHTLPAMSDTTHAKYRVRAYDSKELSVGYKESNEFTVYNNNAPSSPSEFLVPSLGQKVRPLDTITVMWKPSIDADSDSLVYDVDFYNGLVWSGVGKGMTDTQIKHLIPKVSGTTHAKYRVRAYDNKDYSEFTESSEFEIIAVDLSKLSTPNAMSFDGVDDKIELGNHVQLDITKAITIGLKKIKLTKGTVDLPIITKMANVIRPAYTLFVTSLGHLKLTYGHAGNTNDTLETTEDYTGRWIIVENVIDTVNGIMAIKVDGVVVAQKSITVGEDIVTTSNSCDIGYDYTTGRYGNFQLSGVSIFSKALSDTESSDFRNKDLIGNENGLVGCYPFRDGSGTTATDISPFANHATMSGGIGWSFQFAILQDLKLPYENSPQKKENIDYIRYQVNLFRQSNGLTAIKWTDDPLSKKITPIKAIHWNEIQDAINEVYTHMAQMYTNDITKDEISEKVIAHSNEYGIKKLPNKMDAILKSIQNK